MKEYIERDDALNAIERSYWTEGAYERVERLPAADVVERKRGEWEWREQWETHHETRSCDLISCGWYCTECGIELGDYLTKGTGQNIILDLDICRPTLAVCPNCGADMRGAEDG